MDPNRSQKRIYQLADEKGVDGLNRHLKSISEDIATLQGQNGPIVLNDRLNLKSGRNDTVLTLQGGTDFNTDMAQFKTPDGTVRSSIDAQGRYWNKFSSPWEDLLVPLHNGKVTGGAASDPDWVDTSEGNSKSYGWSFPHGKSTWLYFEAQMSHTWKEGSPIYPHIHWYPATTNTGNVYWYMEVVKASVNGVFPLSANYYPMAALGPARGAYKQHSVTALANGGTTYYIDMTGNTISTVLMGRIMRVGGDGLDTYANGAVGLYLDFHYEVDSWGSRSETLK